MEIFIGTDKFELWTIFSFDGNIMFMEPIKSKERGKGDGIVGIPLTGFSQVPFNPLISTIKVGIDSFPLFMGSLDVCKYVTRTET